MAWLLNIMLNRACCCYFVCFFYIPSSHLSLDRLLTTLNLLTQIQIRKHCRIKSISSISQNSSRLLSIHLVRTFLMFYFMVITSKTFVDNIILDFKCWNNCEPYDLI